MDVAGFRYRALIAGHKWHGSFLKRNSQILADLSGEVVTDLTITRNRGTPILLRIVSPRVTSAFQN